LLFIVVALVFWLVIVIFLGPALQNGFHGREITPTFFMFAALLVFGCGMILISSWLLVLAIGEADDISQSAGELQVSYLHLGRLRLKLSSNRIQRIPVRLFRFNLERGFEPAWLLWIGGFRLAVVPREKFSPLGRQGSII
jgi:hypothetical protein